MKNLSDRQLMAMYQNGNDAALAEIHARYSKMLLHYITNTLQRRAPSLISDAYDILQNVFGRIHICRGDFLDGTMVNLWLFTTANRMTRNHVKHECRQRRDKRRNLPLEENYNPYANEESLHGEEPARKHPLGRAPNCLASEMPDAIERVANAEIADLCMGVLPRPDQEIIRLRYFEGYKIPEIADRLRLDKEAVVWRIERSLAKMRRIARA